MIGCLLWLKIKLVIAFAFLSLCGFSQDSSAKKVIYKIPAAEVKPTATSGEAKRVTPEKNITRSCEIDKAKNEATVKTKASDGTISTEKFEIKSEKK